MDLFRLEVYGKRHGKIEIEHQDGFNNAEDIEKFLENVEKKLKEEI